MKKHKITLEYIKHLHSVSTKIEDKILYLSAMVEYLKITNKIQVIKNYDDYKQDFKDLIDIRNNLSHLIKNSLDETVWENKDEIHDLVYQVIQDLI